MLTNCFTACLLSTALCLFTPHQCVVAQTNASGLTPVGMTIRAYVDSSRQNWQGTGPRPIVTMIWYPAAETVREDTVAIGAPQTPVFIAGMAARNAELSLKNSRYPIVLLSHGTGGAALQLMWLGRTLAQHGYIVAAVNHHGNTGAENGYTAQGFALWWERTRDLSAVLDRLLADSEFGSHIDLDRVGAAGFSLGGYTVISLAGGLTDLETYDRFCKSAERDATCNAQAEFPEMMEAYEQVKNDPQVQQSLANHKASFRDERIKAVFAIAPALGGAFTDDGLAPIGIPVSLVAGDADPVAPVTTNAGRFARSIRHARLTVLNGVGHYTFLSECTDLGRRELPLLCTDQTVNRSEVHRQVSQMALEFFDKNLEE